MLIDAHAHIDKYVDDLEETLDEIESNRILTVSNSMDVESWERNQEIAQLRLDHPNVRRSSVERT